MIAVIPKPIRQDTVPSIFFALSSDYGKNMITEGSG
jgi:hypothetical protein